MNYQEVINSIKNSLTDDIDKNIEILNDKINFYRFHRDGQIIVEELTKELNKYMGLKENNEVNEKQNTSSNEIVSDTVIEVNQSNINYIKKDEVQFIEPKEEETIEFADYNEVAIDEKNQDEGALGVTENIHNITNALVTAEELLSFVKYCQNECFRLKNLIVEDAKKNDPLRREYQAYEYGEIYGNDLKITISKHNSNSIVIKSYQEFESACNQGLLKKVDHLDIDLQLSYFKGNNLEKDIYKNEFFIRFKPFDILIQRKSNHVEAYMDGVEKNILNYIEKFDKADTIFG